MIQLDKTTREQQLWIPRSSKGSGDVRKSYKDGYKDGFDEGLRSSKIKLYDGMKLGRSKIYNLDVFDFSAVRQGAYLFKSSNFYKDYYDFTDLVNQMTDGCYDMFLFSYFYKNATVRIEFFDKEKMKNATKGFSKSTVHFYQKFETTSMDNMFSNISSDETHLYLNTSSCTSFNQIFNAIEGKYYISGLDMSNEKNTDEKVFYDGYFANLTDMFLDETTVPRTTLERLMNAYRKDTNKYTKVTFHYGKERWAWDTDNNRWKITGYDE